MFKYVMIIGHPTFSSTYEILFFDFAVYIICSFKLKVLLNYGHGHCQ